MLKIHEIAKNYRNRLGTSKIFLVSENLKNHNYVWELQETKGKYQESHPRHFFSYLGIFPLGPLTRVVSGTQGLPVKYSSWQHVNNIRGPEK